MNTTVYYLEQKGDKYDKKNRRIGIIWRKCSNIKNKKTALLALKKANAYGIFEYRLIQETLTRKIIEA